MYPVAQGVALDYNKFSSGVLRVRRISRARNARKSHAYTRAVTRERTSRVWKSIVPSVAAVGDVCFMKLKLTSSVMCIVIAIT